MAAESFRKEREAEVSALLLRCAGLLDQASGLVDLVIDEGSATSAKREIGEVMGDLYLDVLRDIYSRYPDLEPEGIKG